MSLLVTGLGQLYNGQPKKALSFGVINTIGVPVAAGLLGLSSFGGFVLFLLTRLLLPVYAAFDAYRTASFSLQHSREYCYTILHYAAFVVLVFTCNLTTTHLLDGNQEYEAFHIPSASMEPTLKAGDRLMAKLLRNSNESIVRGDIIVFASEEDPTEPPVLKRVVGLPGETVEVKETSVLINSVPLPESYARWATTVEYPSSKVFPRTVVPADSFFVLGDNRARSRDSRDYERPFVPLNLIKGKALYIYWPGDGDLGRVGKRLTR